MNLRSEGGPWRRPRTGGLISLYDGGWNAPEGAENPYEPHQKRGDYIRAHFWREGYEDRSVQRAIAELI